MPEQTPVAFTLQAPVDLAAEAAAGKRPRFTIHAYHGGAMRVDGFYRPVVIDLAGLRAGDRVPILLDHDRKQIVGQADEVTIGPGGISLAGVVTADDEVGQKVLTHARNGFVWSASVGVGVEKVESLSEEQSAKVNGRSVTGPVYVIRAGRLSEVSLLASGADEKAIADIKAQKTENQIMPQTTEKTDPPMDPIQVEKNRIDEVTVALRDYPDLQAAAVNDGWSAERAREAALLRLRASRPRAPMPEAGGPGAESADVLQAAVALKLWPAHAEKIYGAAACQRAADLKARHIMDIAAAAVATEQGHAPSGQNELLRTAFAPRRMQAGFSNVNMPQALTEGAQRVALEMFKTAPKTWDRLVKRVAVKDFREHKPVGLDGRNGQFEEVASDGELKHGVLLERNYSLQARTVGKMLTITRKDIINDDLGLFADLPEWLASNAARAIADDVYRLLLANAGGFFSEANDNYLEGADTVLGIDGLSAAVQLLRNQTDGDGRILDFAPATLLVGPALESTARMLLNSTTLARYVADGTDLRPEANPFKGVAELAVEPRLESASFPGASAKKWHLFSDGSNGAILLGLLNGIESPIIETGDADFNVLGMQIRAYLDFGVSLGEHRAAVLSLGEAG